MPTSRQKTGRYGEALAERYLIEAGYQILAKNWRCAVGELDLITRQGETLVFVEVRTRRGTQLGSPEESITPAKQAKLTELAYTFLAENNLEDDAWRIDVIAIVLNRQNEVQRLNHIEWAVGF
jgi:putative endonuclease